MATVDDVLAKIEEIQNMIEQMKSEPISANRVKLANGLSDISANFGLLQSGEIRLGNGKFPYDGFSGLRASFPAIPLGLYNYLLSTYDNDTFQIGITDDGKIKLGNNITMDSSGIALTSGADMTVNQWVGLSADSQINEICAVVEDSANNSIYVAGDFSRIGGRNVWNIARYDTIARKFFPFAESYGADANIEGARIPGIIRCMTLYNGILYVGGEFASAGAVANTAYCFQYNIGTDTISSLNATVLTGNVLTMDTNGTFLLLGGSFLNAGGIATADYLVKWTISGGAWASITTGTPLNNEVSKIHYSSANTTWYIGGLFTDATGIAAADYIVSWNGTSFSALGVSTLTAQVRAIIYANSTLFVGGDFYGIKIFDGSTWSTMSNIDGTFYAYGFASNGTYLFIVGTADNFLTSAGYPTYKYDYATSTATSDEYFEITLNGCTFLADGGRFVFGISSNEEIRSISREILGLDEILETYDSLITQLNATKKSRFWAVKQSDESRQSDTTLTDDSELVAILGTGTWSVRLIVFYNTPAAADFKFRLNFGSGTVSMYRAHYTALTNAGTAINQIDTAAGLPGNTVSVLSATAGDGRLVVDAVITVTLIGRLRFSWGQVTSTASDTTVMAGSYIQAAKMAF